MNARGILGLQHAVLLCATLAGAQQASIHPPLDLAPFVGDGPRAELVPILACDKVLVTSTLRLFAFDASTGQQSWSAGPPDGWDALAPRARDALFEGLDAPGLWIAPAAGGSVAVAALQVPQAKKMPKPREDIDSQELPERRLFAFELATGKALWNHAPVPAWDGASGSFAQRMNVIGSPIVVGQRVLVPCASDPADVDYQVACYELASGALSWSTHVVDGHVERNIFGQARCEFAAAPLAFDLTNGLVIAQTGLGVVAALELSTGNMRWRTEYDPIREPKIIRSNVPRPRVLWRTTAPLVVGGVVLSTPRDSMEFLALDPADGHRLPGWFRPLSSLRADVPIEAQQEMERYFAELDVGRPGLGYLIGADATSIYLAADGKTIVESYKPHGLASDEPIRLGRILGEATGPLRAQLVGDALLVPDEHRECQILGLESGHKLKSLSTAGMIGLLATDKILYVLTRDGLRLVER